MSKLLVSELEDRLAGDRVEAKYLVHGTAKAWANLNGTGIIALRDSLNVSSVVDDGTGVYTFSWSSVFSAANYCGVSDCYVGSSGAASRLNSIVAASIQTVSYNGSNVQADADPAIVSAHGILA